MFWINLYMCCYRDVNNVTVIQQHCSPDLESFILVSVYIPLHANVQDAQCILADQTLCVERTNLDSLVIVLGYFNKGNLTHELPKYKPLIKCPTRQENILLQIFYHCYTTVRC